MKIPELFHTNAIKFAGNTALVDEYGSMSFRELSTAIQETAAELKRNGVQQGMGIGVWGGNSRYFIISAYAVMECGAVVMPLSHQLSTNEINDIVATAGLHAILSEPQRTSPFKHVNESRVAYAHEKWKLTFNPSQHADNRIAPHVADPALIRYTSGTTGTSKGVVLSHITIEERIRVANGVLQLGPDDKVVWVLSMAYHFVVSIILYLHHGAGIIICKDFMANSILKQVNDYRATFLYVSPVHIRLLANDAGTMNMDSVKKVISTSTAISRQQCEAFYNRFKKPVIQAYGIIELGLPVINLQNHQSVPEAIGYAVPGYEVAILDSQFSELPHDCIGQLAMRGPGMLDAYLFPPQTRNEILQHGWFMTGDLASKNSEGLIHVEGRCKSMINVAGNKVFPEEVESVLNQFPTVQLSRVCGYPHNLTGESVQAELLIHPGKDKPGIEELRSYCRKQLSPHKIPQKFIFVESLPLTDSGKLRR